MSETMQERVERVVRNHFYPGPIAGSTERLAKGLASEFNLDILASAPSPPVGQERGGWRPMSELPERAYVVIARPLPNGQWSSFTAAVVPGEYDWPAGAMFMELVFPGRSALTKGEADA